MTSYTRCSLKKYLIKIQVFLNRTSSEIKTLTNVGTITADNQAFDISALSTNYKSLTKDNFVVTTSSGGSGSGLSYYGYASASFSPCTVNGYNSDTGILTVSRGTITLNYPGNNGSSTPRYQTGKLQGTVYMVY